LSGKINFKTMKKTFLLVSFVLATAVFSGLVLAEDLPGTTSSSGVAATPALTSNLQIEQNCWNNPVLMKKGWQSQEIKELQQVLSQDKKIYPEGLATGYFGPATENALKRLQAQNGLPQTGTLDENTRRIVLPCFGLKVTYPNGGESFKVNEKIKIAWEVQVPSYTILPTPLPTALPATTTGQMILNQVQNQIQAKNLGQEKKIINPMPQILSIDLIEEKSICPVSSVGAPSCLAMPMQKQVFHIRNVSLEAKGGSGSIEWQIPASIPESSNYKIRISLGKAFMELSSKNDSESIVRPNWNAFDMSDKTFSILGGKPAPSPTVIPMPSILPATSSPDLIRMRKEVTEMMQRLQTLLDQLNKILGM